MMFYEHISLQLVLFLILYGVTGVVPAIAALYLLLRRGNAFAPDVKPPVRLRRWAASFFAVAALGHVWWQLLYIFSCDIYSVGYVVVFVLDYVTLLTTFVGTQLSMLQDRKRPVWPVLVAMIPFVALCGVLVVYPGDQLMQVAFAYILLLFVIFTVYMFFAVRRYGRWLNDNYADLENKKVWLSQVVTFGCLLLFILYTLVDVSSTLLIFLMHLIELVFFCLLLWRVETLPQLQYQTRSRPLLVKEGSEYTQDDEQSVSFPHSEEQMGGIVVDTFDLDYISGLLQQHCVATQLYLQHDLSLQQLAQAIGTNRSYLSQYFSRQGITYNTYINNLRINHFISRYQEVAATGQPIIAQQLASDSGYRSYSTFSLAFKQRTGQCVTAWMRNTHPSP